jgi:aspartokinase/homoserine dehydrogenase 1
VSKNAINVAVIGASGRVGRQLLSLIAARSAAAGLRLVAVANSRASVLTRAGLESASALQRLAAAEAPSGDAFAGVLLLLPRPLVIVDCTASAEVTARYPRWLGAGIPIVTPNKLASSSDSALARAIEFACASSGAGIRDSATVGAQLPLLGTLRELHAAGDRVERFEAVLSGTLSYVLGCVQQGETLSGSVRDAVEQGYAEPDPSADLSGEDAARKLVILLRALGRDIQLADVERVPLVESDLLAEPDAQQLLINLAAIDEQWRARVAVAEARRERWIYRASFENGRARVAPERVALEHPLARLAPCENALILHSAYYRAAPLTIAGPGAGVELTAAAVFADLLAAAHALVRYAGVDSSAALLDAVAA